MEQELGYICPQTKKQSDDECCVSAEDCHAEAINNIISNCEPEQLNQNKMKQQTAVEYLYKIIHARIHIDKDLSEYLEQAKEMEKQQIVDAREDGFNSTYAEYGETPRCYLDGSSKQYYNETFKSE